MNQQGFLKLIIFAVALIIILSLLGISLKSVFKNETLKENFDFVWKILKSLWDNFLKTPAAKIKELMS